MRGRQTAVAEPSNSLSAWGRRPRQEIIMKVDICRCSSVVEHVIGNDGVASPILASGTIKKRPKGRFLMVSGKDGLAKQVLKKSAFSTSYMTNKKLIFCR